MSKLRIASLANQTDTASIPTDTVINGSAKAWVNFNGTGTVAIRASFNVSSITDNGISDYTINFSNAMADTNYSACISGTGQGGTNGQWVGSVELVSMTSTSLRIAQTATSSDASIVCASVFR